MTAAIEATQAHALNLIDQDMGASAVDVTESFLAACRALLTYTDFAAGCALVAVTVAAETEGSDCELPGRSVPGERSLPVFCRLAA